MEGQWHQNVHEPETFFCRRTRKSVKTDVFYSSGRYSETKRNIGMGNKRSSDGCPYGIKCPFAKNWVRGIFDRVLVARSQVRATKCNPLANYKVLQKSISPIGYGHAEF